MDTAENIDAGVKIVGEKTNEMVSEIAGKTSQVAGSIFEKVKKGIEEVYHAGSDVVESISEKTQDYADKYKHKMDIKKLIDEQHALYIKLGSIIYEKYKSGEVPLEQLYNEEHTKDLLQKIKRKEIEIVKAGQELDKIGK